MTINQRTDTAISDPSTLKGFPLRLAASLYVLSFGLTLALGRRRMWDDTSVYTNESYGRSALTIAGSPPWRAWLEFEVLAANPITFRLVTFAVTFLTGLLFYLILVGTPHVTARQARIASLLFLVAPVNSARISMITAFYTMTTLAFFLGWWLTTSARRPLIAAGIGLLLVANSHSALQPLTLLVVGHLMYVRWSTGSDLRKPATWLPTLLLLVPFGAEILNALFWPVGDDYAQYYAIRPQGVVRATALLSIAVVVLLVSVVRFRMRRSEVLLPAVGGVALALGSYAYIVGGHLVGVAQWLLPLVPEHSDWDSRHTALLGIGVGLIGAGFAREPASHGATRVSALSSGSALAVTVFVLLNLTFSLEYFRDGIERHDFIREARTTVDLSGIRSLVVVDRTLGTDARGRIVRDAEWDWLLAEAGWPEVEFIFRFGRGDCQPEPPTHALVVAMTTGRLRMLIERDTDLWLKVEPYNEREHGLSYISNQPGMLGQRCIG